MAVTYEPESAKLVIKFASDTETFTDIDPEVDDATLGSFYEAAFMVYDDNADSASKVVTYKMKTGV